MPFARLVNWFALSCSTARSITNVIDTHELADHGYFGPIGIDVAPALKELIDDRTTTQYDDVLAENGKVNDVT
jgi:hypothetical protein